MSLSRKMSLVLDKLSLRSFWHRQMVIIPVGPVVLRQEVSWIILVVPR